MGNLETAVRASRTIRSLALAAVGAVHSPEALRAARRRAICPVDYMRYAEFDVLLQQVALREPMTVLDVGSPQWLSLYLASKHPNIAFHYVNIVSHELDPFREIAESLGLRNLTYRQADVRDIGFGDASFDRVVSVSVIEHVAPEEGGDLLAMRELKRILKPSGELFLTVPYKAEGRMVYVDGPVYERGGGGKKFFAREYDQTTFQALVDQSGFASMDAWTICEREGLFAVDYHEWGPGKDRLAARVLAKARKLVERRFGQSLDRMLAQRYLRVSREPSGRLVNIAARLTKER